jgi:hypothetical protein
VTVGSISAICRYNGVIVREVNYDDRAPGEADLLTAEPANASKERQQQHISQKRMIKMLHSGLLRRIEDLVEISYDGRLITFLSQNRAYRPIGRYTIIAGWNAVSARIAIPAVVSARKTDLSQRRAGP